MAYVFTEIFYFVVQFFVQGVSGKFPEKYVEIISDKMDAASITSKYENVPTEESTLPPSINLI